MIPILCGQVIFVVAGVLSIKLVSHVVSPEVYGLYGLFLTLVPIGTLLTHAGLNNYAMRCWHREQALAGPYAHFLWRMNLRAARPMAWILVVAVVVLALVQRDRVWFLMLPLLYVTNIALTTNAVAVGMLASDDRRWLVCGLSLVGNVTRTILPAGAVLVGGASMAALGVGYTLYAVILLVATLLIYRPFWKMSRAPEEKERQWLKELGEYTRPYLWMGVGGWFLQNADRWLVVEIFGKEKSGLFTLAANLGPTISGMVAMSMMQLVFPRVFRAADQARDLSDWKRMARFCDWLTVGFLVACIAGILLLAYLGPYLVGVLIDADYREAMPLLLPVGLAAISVQVNQFYFLLLQGQQNGPAMVRVTLAVAAVKTAGSLIAALISWPCFLAWLAVSMLFSVFIGRTWIRRLVFQGALDKGRLPAAPA